MSLSTEQVALFEEAIAARRQFPAVLKRTFKQAQVADINTTERILVNDGGIAACLAYLIFKYEKDSHMRGRTTRKELVRYLDELPIEARRSSAVQLRATMKPHEARMVRWARQPPRATAKQSRCLRSRTSSSEKAHAEGDTGLRDPHEYRNTPTVSLPSSTTRSDQPIHQGSGHAVSPPQHGDISQSSQQDVVNLRDHSDSQPQPSSSSANNDEHTIVNASIIACNQLFPEYLAGAIRRNSKKDCTSVAAVSITFPHGNNDKVFLSIEVMPNKIEHIAWELFATRLENDGKTRYACMGSTKFVAKPSFALHCCRIASISRMFGQQLEKSIYANPAFKEERLNEDNCTRCIWMVVPLATVEYAKINIVLHPREGTTVKDFLFPSA